MTTSNILFIIFAGSNSWGTYTRRIHYEALTHFGKVIVLMSPPNFRNRIQRFIKRDIECSTSPHHVLRKNNLIILPSPFTLPLKVYRSFRLIRKFQCRILRKVLQREIDRLGSTISEIVIIFTDARQRLWWDVLKDCKRCFDLTDASWLLLPKSYKEGLRFKRLDDNVWMLSHCDIAFCTSRRLTDFASHFNEHAFYLPNTWKNISHSSQELPNSFSSLANNRNIGFLGNINDWLDLDLLDYIAKNIHDSDLVFVGPINGSVAFKQRFEKLANNKKLIYMGPVLQNQTGRAIDLFEICIIPYTIDHFKSYVHPNKLYQYLSRGKPVVTTRFSPDLSIFSELISIANDYEDFVFKLSVALHEKNPDIVDKRKRFAIANSAIERARQRIDLLRGIEDRNNRQLCTELYKR